MPFMQETLGVGTPVFLPFAGKLLPLRQITTIMNLPTDFLFRTRRLMGEEACAALCEALRQVPPVSVRMNTLKCADLPQGGRPVAWSRDGYYLPVRPSFTFDPLFHAGCYYVQEAASMFLEQALRRYVTAPVAMLDLCAAPGGKSTLARSVLPAGSLLVANEVMRNRAQVLAENLVKWGDGSIIVTNNDPADFAPFGEVFDVMLTDVPCSGEGMFRKDETAVAEWSVDNVEICWQRQRRILRDSWPCLKPGGLLIYSTCTFNREENEDNVAWIARELGAEVLPLQVPDGWRITGNLTGADFPVYRFLPSLTEGEGLFLAVLRKEGLSTGGKSYEQVSARLLKKNLRKAVKGGKPAAGTVPDTLKTWLVGADEDVFSVTDGLVTAFPAVWHSLYLYLKEQLKVIYAGVTVAEQKGRDWQPHHALAMSTARTDDSFQQVELSYEQAVAYLRKEAVTLAGDTPRGYVLLTYGGHPLGFAKNVGNRANNLYPNEWRIRSGYLPSPEETALVCGWLGAGR